jgi:hypothetical protein
LLPYDIQTAANCNNFWGMLTLQEVIPMSVFFRKTVMNCMIHNWKKNWNELKFYWKLLYQLSNNFLFKRCIEKRFVFSPFIQMGIVETKSHPTLTVFRIFPLGFEI